MSLDIPCHLHLLAQNNKKPNDEIRPGSPNFSSDFVSPASYFLEPISQVRPGYLLAASSWQVLSAQSTTVPLASPHPNSGPHQWTYSLITVNHNDNQFFSTYYVPGIFENDSIARNYFPNFTEEGLFFTNTQFTILSISKGTAQ